MRDPYEIKEILFDNDPNPSHVYKIPSVPKFDVDDYDLMNEKEFSKYMGNIEKICRGSFEYRQLTNYLRDNMDMNKCAFMQNVSNENNYKIKIHIHHEPFTLYDITRTIYNKRVRMRHSINENLVAEEVMYLHYSLLVGLVPLSETVHELVHGNYLFVPMDKVFGNIERFIGMYEPYFEPETRLLLDKIRKYTSVYNSDLAKNIRLIERNYLYLDMTDVYQLPTYDSIVEKMNQRIDTLRQQESSPVIELKLGDRDLYDRKVFMVRDKPKNLQVI